MSKNEWSLGLCDCCSYRDHENKCWFIPKFFPQAIFGSCCIEGEIQTILNQEEPCCCRMGRGGWCTCLIQLPIGFFGPFGGMLMAVCCGPRLRNEVVSTYNINDPGCCGHGWCLGTLSKLSSSLYPSSLGLMYPCSLFQILFTLRDFERRGVKPLTAKLIT
jgi:hypothetical protein